MKRWRNARLAGILCLVPLILLGLRELAHPRKTQLVEHASVSRSNSSTSATGVGVPRFAEPEQARRYFDAMTEGDRRAIALIDEALTTAKEQGAPDPNYVARLTEERATRAARLSASQRSRMTLGR